MQAASDDSERTLWEAIKNLSWFTQIFAWVVGGLSITEIWQMIRKDQTLIPALQRIVDGYHWITKEIGEILEPIFAPVVGWANATLGWHLVLYPHWRPLFLLGMVFLTAFARVGWRGERRQMFFTFGASAFGLLVGTVLAGLVPLSGSWWQQGLIAALPLAIACFFLVISLGRRPFLPTFQLFCVWFFVAAALSLVPGFAEAAGMMTVAGFVIFLGSRLLWLGLSKRGPAPAADVRFGLTILGGFVTAGLILGADWAIRAFA